MGGNDGLGAEDGAVRALEAGLRVRRGVCGPDMRVGLKSFPPRLWVRWLLLRENKVNRNPLKRLNEKLLFGGTQEINDLKNFLFYTAMHDLAKLKG